MREPGRLSERASLYEVEREVTSTGLDRVIPVLHRQRAVGRRSGPANSQSEARRDQGRRTLSQESELPPLAETDPGRVITHSGDSLTVSAAGPHRRTLRHATPACSRMGRGQPPNTTLAAEVSDAAALRTLGAHGGRSCGRPLCNPGRCHPDSTRLPVLLLSPPLRRCTRSHARCGRHFGGTACCGCR